MNWTKRSACETAKKRVFACIGLLLSALVVTACSNVSTPREVRGDKSLNYEDLIATAKGIYSAEEIPEGYVSVLVYETRNNGPWQLEAPYVLLLPKRMVYWTDSDYHFLAFDLNRDEETLLEDTLSSPPNAVGFLFYDNETLDAYNVFITTANFLESRKLSEEEKEAYAEILASEIDVEDFGPHAATRETIEVDGFRGTYVHKLLPAIEGAEEAFSSLWSRESFGAILRNERLIFKLQYIGPPVERTPDEIEAALEEALTVLHSIRFLDDQ